MEVPQSVLCEIAFRSEQNKVTGIDLGRLIRSLILFDRVVLKSVRLGEIAFLIRSFGKSGFGQLLQSEILKISCESTTLVTDIHQNGVRHLPPEHFSFGIVQVHDRETYLQKGLLPLQGIPGLKNAERTSIEKTIWDSMLRPKQTFGSDLLAQVDSDIRSNTPALCAAILKELGRGLAVKQPIPESLEIEIEESPTRVFRVKNRIERDFGLTPGQTHSLLQRSVEAVCNLNHRLAEMEAYASITGFLEDEAPLLFRKLAGIIRPLNPSLPAKQFERVIRVADIPDFKAGQKIDVGKLMTIRESSECGDFRKWIATLENVSDAEIAKMTSGVRQRLGALASSTGGKVVRFAATTGIGFIPSIGPLAGIAAGAIDSFLVERVLPKSGVVAFLSEMYPSLFVSP